MDPLQYLAYCYRLLANRGYQPHPKQLELQNDKHRYKVIRCGRRFGKTVFAVNTIIESAVLTSGDYWFVAPTYRQAKEIAWRVFGKYTPEEFVTKRNETELSIELHNGSRISLKGADNPDSLRGVGLNGVVMDEYAFTDSYAWTVISPILQDKKGWAIFISTPDGYNHFYDLYNAENTDNDFRSFHFTSYDNPYLDREELEKERLRMSEERFEQEYMAEFMRRSGAVWKNFRRSVHVVDRIDPETSDTVVGWIDFGFGPGHPTDVGWSWVRTEQIHTFDGFQEEGLSIEQIDEKMTLQTKGLRVAAVFYDKARPDLADALKRKGWPMIPAEKDVEVGIARVEEFMQVNPITNKPRWTIARNQTKKIEQIEQYVWQEVRGEDGRFKQVPKKENDDAPDGLRYMLNTYSRPNRNQEDQARQIVNQRLNEEY